MLQGLTEIFSGDINALIPLALQRAMFAGKNPDDFLYHFRYQLIRLLNRCAGFIHKLALDLKPARAKLLGFLTAKEGSRQGSTSLY